MKHSSCLLACVLALSLVPGFASADDPSASLQAQRRVEADLVRPLAAFEAERSKFSRARMPPGERRVRVLRAAAVPDPSGRQFLPFAIDVRYHGGEWVNDDIVGCLYPATGNIFVKRGEAYRPAAFLLGKKGDPVAGVCAAEPAKPKA